MAVIAIHTSTNFIKVPNINLLAIINVIVVVFSDFAVPLFIFISGFVLSLKYKDSFSQKSFYKKRVESIFPQYAIFSTLYILSRIMFSAINGKLELPPITRVIFYFLTASSSLHLWFIALVVQFYIFYPHIIKKYEYFERNNKVLFFIGLSLVMQQCWLTIKAFALDYFNSSIYFNSITYFNTVVNTLLARIFLSHIFYFILGIYVCKNYITTKDQILKYREWTIPTILVFTGVIAILWIDGIIEYGSFLDIPYHYFIVPNLIQSLYFPLVFLVLLRTSLKLTNVKNKYSNIILSAGKYSFGIYLIHPFYMQIIKEIIYPQIGIYPERWIFYPVLFTFTVIISYYSIDVIAHSSYSGIIVGIKNKELKK